MRPTITRNSVFAAARIFPKTPRIRRKRKRNGRRAERGKKLPTKLCRDRIFPAPRDENETKIGAEWQGNDCRWYGSSPYSNSADGKFSAEDYESRRREQVEAAKKKRLTERRKVLFALAFVGLLLDFICGIGFLMCLPVAIVASVDAKRLYVSEKKTSAQLIWAMVVGYVGAVLGLIFFILLI